MNTPKLGFVWTMVLMISLVFSSVGAASVGAQGTFPPVQPSDLPAAGESETLPGNPYQPQRDTEGRWIAYLQAGSFQDNRPQAVSTLGGPDNYGYVWDDSFPLSWIDASSGVDLGLSPATDHSGPIDIGFNFKYYENTYSQLFVSLHGIVSFAGEDLDYIQSTIPSSATPNNVIAPHWAPVDAVGGYVRYLRGGTAPDRWFVVEWNRVQSDGVSVEELDEYTFEAILHENGNIVFQYGSMQIAGLSYMCSASGIENANGVDGLQITGFCNPISSNHAVLISRPAPAARLQIMTPGLGSFARAGERVRFEAQVRNTGELGPDTYELHPIMTNPNWPVALFAADGVTLLVDTNGNSSIDTGAVAQGGITTIVVIVQVSNPAHVGDSTQVTLGLVSSVDPAKSGEIILRIAIPTSFTQAYIDGADGAQKLMLVRPDQPLVRRASAAGVYGWNGGVVEAPNGNLFTTWERDSCLDVTCFLHINELEYAILDHSGNTIRPAGKLTDLSGAARDQYDYSVGSAVAPNGSTGVFWRRVIYNENWEMNNNLYFAVLDSAGNFTTPPVSITNNQDWTSTATRYYQPRIAATGDNRFVMAWYTYDFTTGPIRDIHYAIRDWQNNPIASGKVTEDTPGNDQSYIFPTVSALANNRVIVAFSHYANQTYSAGYVILDSAGMVIKPVTTISGYSSGLDAAQLSGGNILLAWTSYASSKPQISYALLNGTGYDLIVGPVMLDNPAALTGGDYVSVSPDQAGRAVLTWTDYDSAYRSSLYYALIAENGTVLSQPVIFRSAAASAAGTRHIETSYEGLGNTTYTQAPSSPQVDVYVQAAELIGASPSGNALIPVQFGNAGASAASDVTITATLDSNLSYVSDTLGIAPVIVGDTLTWAIPGEMAYLSYGEFNLVVAVPDAAVGTRYPVEIVIASAGPEGVPANNLVILEVMVAQQTALPAVLVSP